MYKELMIGCGQKRTKDLRLPTAKELAAHLSGGGFNMRLGTEFENLVTLDINHDHEPTFLCDLRHLPLTPFRVDHFGERVPFEFGDNVYDEIHAYEVLEHIGQQGDAETFFGQFSEFWRILKPDGLFFASVPMWCSPWAWGDPSHTRIITAGTLSFLSQKEYAKQVGKTPMSDFRYMYKADFDIVHVQETAEHLLFILRAVK